MPDTLRNNQTGFTLVELAIALMVIGLLIGGVLKGQELIENAKVTALTRQISAYKTATLIFQNTYNALPGDIKNPQTRIPNCTTSPCRDTGNGNGKLDPAVGSTTGPTVIVWPNIQAIVTLRYTGDGKNFWRHLAKAGLITGVDPDIAVGAPYVFGTYMPETPYGSGIDVGYTNRYQVNGFSLLASNSDAPALPARAAAAIDRKLDDGSPADTGQIAVYLSGISLGPTCIKSPTEYAENATSGGCNLFIAFD